jgi:hypothetical protein
MGGSGSGRLKNRPKPAYRGRRPRVHVAGGKNMIGQASGGIGHGIKRWVQCSQTQGKEIPELAGTRWCLSVHEGV